MQPAPENQGSEKKNGNKAKSTLTIHGFVGTSFS